MAVDTPEKRFSILNLGGLTGLVFVADGSDANSNDERLAVMGLYSGLDPQAIAAPTDLGIADTIRFVTGNDDIEEGMKIWFFTNMPSPPADIDDYSANDLEWMFLSQVTGKKLGIDDMWLTYLSAYRGSVQDRQLLFWRNGGVV